MVNIEYKENMEEEYYQFVDREFNKFAIENGVECNYKPFAFIAKEDDKIVGLLTGHSYYKEVYISDLIVLEEYRKQHIGSELVKEVENYFKDKQLDNINLTTRRFQAPDFYKKCGFELEFIRKDKKNPNLDRYYFVKFFE